MAMSADANGIVRHMSGGDFQQLDKARQTSAGRLRAAGPLSQHSRERIGAAWNWQVWRNRRSALHVRRRRLIKWSVAARPFKAPSTAAPLKGFHRTLRNHAEMAGIINCEQDPFNAWATILFARRRGHRSGIQYRHIVRQTVKAAYVSVTQPFSEEQKSINMIINVLPWLPCYLRLPCLFTLTLF